MSNQENKRGRPSTLTGEQVAALEAKVAAGVSIKKAAEEVGVKYHVARHHIVKVNGLTVKRGRKGGVTTDAPVEETTVAEEVAATPVEDEVTTETPVEA